MEEMRGRAVPDMHQLKKKGGKLPWALMAAAAVVVVVAIVVVRMVSSWLADSSVNNKEFQALFLTNGQVYFGHLSDVSRGYTKLTDIYYLQVQQTVQPGDKNQNQQQQVSLAKLGNELHGPEDVMYVARAQVLFWENLKDSGKVVQAIKNYQSTQKK